MAESMTPGNRLYLYRLLSEQVGFGVQTTVARVEELLAADDVRPDDMGFSSARELLESDGFAGCVRIEVFKKGRVLATLSHDAAMDAALSAAVEEARAEAEDAVADKAGAKSKPGKPGKGRPVGKKAWKKSAKAKVARPVKPGGKRRDQEAREAARLAAERAAQEAARAEEEARVAAEHAAAEEAARAAAEEEARKAEEAKRAEEARVAAEQAAREEAARAERDRRRQTEHGAARLCITYDPGDAAPSDAVPADAAPADGDALADDGAPAGRVPARKANKGKAAPVGRGERSARGDRVARGAAALEKRHTIVLPPSPIAERLAAARAQEAAAGEATVQVATAGEAAAGEAAAEATATKAASVRANPAQGAAAQGAAAQVDSAWAVSAQAAPVRSGEPLLRAEEAPTAKKPPFWQPKGPLHTGQPGVAHTDGEETAGQSAYNDMVGTNGADGLVSQMPESPVFGHESDNPAQAAISVDSEGPVAPAPAVRPAPAASAYDAYPASIARDVYCPSMLLSVLTRILPIQVDLMALLDEDWLVARATGTVSGNRARATFPLRYLQEDGVTPVEVTIRRVSRGGSHRWELALVDGDDGTSPAHEAAGLEGLPQADEGAWADLSATASWRPQASSPVRELAQFASIGTWDAMLGSLARIAAPERWSYPGQSAGVSAPGANATRYGVLREYVAVTFHRVRAQGRLLQAADGGFAAFNTGLVTAALEDVHACFEPARGVTPWRFAGFATAGSGELGRRLASELADVPQPASYLTELADVTPAPGAPVVLDHHALLTSGLGRLPRGFLREGLTGVEGAWALLDRMSEAGATPAARSDARRQLSRFIADVPAVQRRLARALDDAAEQAVLACRRSYRTAVPVFDPVEDRMKLLVPLRLLDDRTVDAALVLERQPSGAYQGTGLLDLPRAYACARVVSAEMPSWLAPERVLG